jgi:toxin ParE1/3/4
MLREEPRLGPRRDDIRARLRMLVENPYLVFYQLTPDAENESVERVEILRVLDGRRDLLRLL